MQDSRRLGAVLWVLRVVLVTIGATIYQLAARQPESAVFAVIVGLLAAFVAYGRWRLAPLRAAVRRPGLQPAY